MRLCFILTFSFRYSNELAAQIKEICTDGIQLHPDIVKIFLLLFADDIVLFSSTIKGLQNLIDQLELYCSNCKLQVNTEKTKVLVFKKGNKLSSREKWFFNSQPLKIVTSYKYLGVTFTGRLTWNYHTSNAAMQAKKILMGILHSLKTFTDLSYQTFFKIFDTKITPILLYGAEVWGHTEYRTIELVHLYACKRFLGVKNSTSSVMVYGECGRVPLYIFQHIRILKYWFKILKMPIDRLPRKCYNMMLLYEKHGSRSWVYDVKSLLNDCGYGYVWRNQCVPNNPDSFLVSLRQRLKDIYLQKWASHVLSSEKCNYYKLFKTTISPEYYLFDINFKRFRISLAQFRCSSHRLRIEVGRHRNIDRELRICEQCDLNVIEDEFHFLLVCPKYDHLRRKYIDLPGYVHPTIQRFTTIMSTTDKDTLKNLSMFIYHAMLIRI
ncbi:uncharacterized protein [Haliotis cracherodii]|uniref:uncharacterized protein n=1 Tax=Haliotis cracherodii TaxID=6455 RepID=UPI0039EB6DFB